MDEALGIEPMTDEQDRRISEAMEREQSRLRNFIRRRVADEGDVEDILQDVFSELVETYRLMRPVEQVGAWLYRVARNRITDLFRRRKPEAQLAAFVVPEDQGIEVPRAGGVPADHNTMMKTRPYPATDLRQLPERSCIAGCIRWKTRTSTPSTKRLASPILPRPLAPQLNAINVEINDLYSAYDASWRFDIGSAMRLCPPRTRTSKV